MTPFLSMVISFVLCLVGGILAIASGYLIRTEEVTKGNQSLFVTMLALTIFVIASIV